MEPLSAYEIQRLKNIEFNKSVLRSLEIPRLDDLLPPRSVVSKPKQGVKRKRNDSGKKRKKRLSNLSLVGNGYMTRAKRRHLTNIENGEIVDENENGVDDDEDDLDYKKQKPKFNQNIFGSIPDIPVGTVWQFRSLCSHDGVHRATVAGIHGGADGCYSIALSGGYEDDVDYGDLFTYTGEGGRNLKGTKADPKNLRTAPQSKDQKLDRGNLALSKSVETGKPVRVVRGFKLKSPYAPAEGYRYDGLYTVEKFWNARGLSGFGVYRFALRRCPDQAPPPWLDQSQENQTSGDENQTEGDENQTERDENQTEGDEDQTEGDENKTERDENQTSGDENQTEGDENQTDGDENQTEGNKNQTEGDENKTERDENQTEGDENKTERDEDQTERDENQTEGDENQTEEDKNQTEKDENQTERDENQTERDVNKTEGDENQTGYGNQTKRDEKQTETDEIQTEADKTQTESDETKQEMKTKHKRRRKPNRSR